MSLRLMTCRVVRNAILCAKYDIAYILVPQMLEELKLPVCALGEDRCAERLHDFLDSHGLAGELILCGAASASEGDLAHVNVAEHTKQGRMRPCPRAAGQCTFAGSQSVATKDCGGGSPPACDLECRAEDLGTHEFSHGEQPRYGGCYRWRVECS